MAAGRTITVATSGDVTVSSATPSYPSEVIGAAPQWADDSDATYANIRGVYQGSTGISGAAYAALVTGAAVGSNPAVTIEARLRVSSPDGLRLPYVDVLYPNGGALLTGESQVITPTAPSWVTVPLSGSTEAISGFLFEVRNGNPLTLQVQTPLGFPFPATATGYLWVIYEAEVLVTLPSADAPPCRIFPRSDGLGVGASRNYPTPKSRQRSSRGVGYY